MPGNLANVIDQQVLHRVQLLGLLAQDDLTDDGGNIRVGQLDCDVETPDDLLENRRAGKCGLACRHQHDPSLELFRQRLRHLLHADRAVGIFADELLRLVENDQRQRHLAILHECSIQRLDHVFSADRRRIVLAEHSQQNLARGGCIAESVRAYLDQRIAENRRHEHVLHLVVPVLAFCLNLCLDGILQPLSTKPKNELRLLVGFGEAYRAKHDLKKSQLGIKRTAADKLAHRRVNATMTLGLDGQFFQEILDLCRKRLHIAWQSPVLQRRVRPQIRQHLHEVRLAGAIEAADPCGGLRIVRQIREVRIEDANETLFILAFAHERRKLVLQNSVRSL